MKNKNAKIRYVFKVTRELSKTVPPEELQDEIDFSKSVEEEAGEYLYGGNTGNEKISVTTQISYDNGKTWKNIRK
jgi:hypothetical protein